MSRSRTLYLHNENLLDQHSINVLVVLVRATYRFTPL